MMKDNGKKINGVNMDKEKLINIQNDNAIKRKIVLQNLEQLNLSLPEDAPSTVEIVRKDRLGNLDLSLGRIR